jgi:hypothetical protein
MERIIASLMLIIVSIGVPFRPVGQVNSACTTGGAPVALSIDGVSLEGCLPFAPKSAWVRPDPAGHAQVAYTQGTGAGYSVTAIPFGSRLASEVFPQITQASSEDELRADLLQSRKAQGGASQVGPEAQIFGRSVVGLQSTLDLPTGADATQRTRITEWLAIAGGRLWIFRSVQPVFTLWATSAVTGLNFASADLDAPSTSLAAAKEVAITATATATSTPTSALNFNAAVAGESNLPAPAWWHGSCDSSRYSGAYKLGGSYRGVDACGPLPGLGYQNLTTYFYDDAFPVYEWQCVELVMRFMYLAYGVPPYAANGGYVVSAYSGSRLSRVNNGTNGRAPVPGDILSYCSSCSYGHTSVVTSSNVNSSGNGSVTVMEENWTYTGQTTLSVSNWYVIGDAGYVYGWLHGQMINPTATPTRTPTCAPTATYAPTPSLRPTPAPGQIYFPFIYNQYDTRC